MAKRRQQEFQTIKSEGALLPADFLKRVVEGDKEIEGLKSEDYHYDPSERLSDATSRSWTACRDAWQRFQKRKEELPDSDRGTTLTRESWLLVLFRELGYGVLHARRGPFEIDDKPYSVSHEWQRAPIHLISFRFDLDKSAKGIFRTSPHSLVQELLNRSDDHLWALLSNGLQLRILRDNVSFTRAAYVEFDLEGMMEGEIYSDFVLLWLLCHPSRVEGDIPEQCWLEKWHQTARRQGTRALDRLREGVERAIQTFGQGFLAHRGNGPLRQKLTSGELTTQQYYQQLLRLVYRLIFLFVAEDRDLLLLRDIDDDCRQRYVRHYSMSRVLRLAERRRGTRHGDLWQGIKLVMGHLYKGQPNLGLPALGSMLFSDKAMPDLECCELANDQVLEAIRHLAFTVDRNVLRQVDYKNLGSEELGSVYESLLELHPDINADSATFELATVAGSERKTTGSYYTPSSLINCLLDSALDPVVEDASKRARSSSDKDNRQAAEEEALLNLKICDPACGSGHFLIAAANRIAHHLASVRTGDEEPSPAALRAAFRDVVSHCIYGVDLNPMAVELCKVALWLESLDPGKPLSFLDHRILCGNSLIGVTPRLIEEGIPDAAFKPIEGDDKEYCKELKRQNKQERTDYADRQQTLFQPWEQLGNLASAMMNISQLRDDSIDTVEDKREQYENLIRSSSYLFGRLLADAWCAAFFWQKVRERDGGQPYPITEQVFRGIQQNPHSAPPWLIEEVTHFAQTHKFFHWHIAFPDVFGIDANDEEEQYDADTGWMGGFDVLLSNPPYGAALSQHERQLINNAQQYSQQTANTAADFLERCLNICGSSGGVGLVIPKSFTYSYSWQRIRTHLMPLVTIVVDVGCGWEEVLLEQILICYTPEEEKHGSMRVGTTDGTSVYFTQPLTVGLLEKLQVLPTGLDTEDMALLNLVVGHSELTLSELCDTQRGTGLQRFSTTLGNIPLLAGRNIREFTQPVFTKFLEEDAVDKARIRWTTPPQAVFQNIVAHVTKPSDHIKLIGTVVHERAACLDTVNLLHIRQATTTPYSLCAYLMSHLVNWFVYACIYNKAIRTMHFDGYFLAKIPMPDVHAFGALDDIAVQLSETPNHGPLWDTLNERVYDLYHVPPYLRGYLNKSHSQRYCAEEACYESQNLR